MLMIKKIKNEKDFHAKKIIKKGLNSLAEVHHLSLSFSPPV